MDRDEHFTDLVASDNPTGEVVGVDRFLVTIKGLKGSAVGALVLFENGDKGMVRDIEDGEVVVLNCDSETTPMGSLVVLESQIFSVNVGKALVGRVVDPFGRVLDGGPEINFTEARPIFNEAPGIVERALLKDQLYSGVSVVDMMFPIVLGQRIAILGDTKSGKTNFLLQLGANQKTQETIMVYVLIGKRRSEIDQAISSLTESGMMERSIIVVADVFDSLAQSYIAPYAGCAMAEFLWHAGNDVVIVYDDLYSHAKVYREISLLADANPGRDSYPADMFYSHSSLLERAGKLASTGKTLTALPIVLTPSDDITAYLPTSIMSITDGQLIFDLATFRRSIRPALNVGLSVSRVGGRAQNKRQKQITREVFKKLASFRQALEFSHFGSDLSEESKQLLVMGQQLQDVFKQLPSELYDIRAQELLITVILHGGGQTHLDIPALKKLVSAPHKYIESDKEFDRTVTKLLDKVEISEDAA